MLSDPETYDLNELAEAAGVTPRTIRYYVQQGLLPSPGTRGPGSRYDRAYLDRLQLIRRLQRQHLPLAEIRRRLDELDDEGIRAALAAAVESPAPSSALDYVRSVLAAPASSPPPEGAARGTLGSVRGSLSAFARRLSAPPPETESPPDPSLRSTRSTWDRIPLAPDIELHVRRPLSREQNRFVDRLIDFARQQSAEEP